MATRTLLPDATGSFSAWTVGAGSRPTLAQTNDGNTSYAFTQGNVRDSYAVDDLQPSDAIVDSVEGRAQTRRQGASAGTSKIFTRHSGTNDDSGSFFSHNLGGYTLHTQAFANAPGGGGWTPTIVDATEVGILHGGGSSDVRYTQLFLSVVTTEGGYSFITFYCSVLVPLLKDLLGAADLAQFSTALRSVYPRVLFDAGETRRLLECYRARRVYARASAGSVGHRVSDSHFDSS